ncbi:MAG: MBL fold metallo-hydrolase [Candidatus Bathyarchaeota archaeon]|nr:MAG: MBL fold metallo-hydrolase [Candidatus Bathyarchaeota archaeon]
MNVRMFTVGTFFTNCYVVWCDETREGLVIDPGFERQNEWEEILGIIKEGKLQLKFIIDTHGHPDHTCGNGIVKDITKAPIFIHEMDANMLSGVRKQMIGFFGFPIKSSPADGILRNGDVVKFGKLALLVLHTPGHSQGSISLVGEDCVFTGDTLFAGSIGRVDLPGGSGTKIMRSLREKLAVLPEKLIVYPGHGPKTTIREEKKNNPFLQKGFDVSLL